MQYIDGHTLAALIRDLRQLEGLDKGMDARSTAAEGSLALDLYPAYLHPPSPNLRLTIRCPTQPQIDPQKPPGPFERASKWERRNRAVVVAGGLRMDGDFGRAILNPIARSRRSLHG
jgi:hypothetical protein